MSEFNGAAPDTIISKREFSPFGRERAYLRWAIDWEETTARLIEKKNPVLAEQKRANATEMRDRLKILVEKGNLTWSDFERIESQKG